MSLAIHFSLTLPKDGTFRNKKWKEEILRAMKYKSEPELKKLFNQTVFGWSTKPRAKFDHVWEGDRAVIDMYAAGEGADTWNLVSSGSPHHRIPPKNFGGLLWFRPGYKAATKPGQLQSGRAYRSGKYVNAFEIPDHPGFEARKFPELIEREFERKFINQMQDAFNKAAREK